MLSRFPILQLFSSFATLLVFSAQVQAQAPSNHFDPTNTTVALYIDDVLAVGEIEAKLVNASIFISGFVVRTIHRDWIKSAMTIQTSSSVFDDFQGEDYSNASILQC